MSISYGSGRNASSHLLLVRCPTCGAMEGERCRSLAAHKSGVWHAARNKRLIGLVEALAAIAGTTVRWQ